MLSSEFMQRFFGYEDPTPNDTPFSEREFRNNDFKICLQIATCSYLKHQSDPKSNAVIFSCKTYGKSCFEVIGFKQIQDGQYYIDSDYTSLKHSNRCELQGQHLQFLKIYNLMKLKRDLIEQFMQSHQLMDRSPTEILSAMSSGCEGGYFFEEKINSNSELRRKLRKRFDNIVNIDIKKITKGGLDPEKYDQSRFVTAVNKRDNAEDCFVQRPIPHKTKKVKKINRRKVKSLSRKTSPRRQTSQCELFYEDSQPQESQKSRSKIQFPEPRIMNSIECIDQQSGFGRPFFGHDSEYQLEQIRELNQTYFPSHSILKRSVSQINEPAPTINDEVRENARKATRRRCSIQNVLEKFQNFDNQSEQPI